MQITNSNLKTQVKEKILQNDELNNQIFLLENSNADLKIRHNILNQKIAELQEKKDELNTCNSFLVRQNEKILSKHRGTKKFYFMENWLGNYCNSTKNSKAFKEVLINRSKGRCLKF